MRARVEVDAFADAAAWAAKRTMARPHVPALAGVLVSVWPEDVMTLDATDLRGSGTATLSCDTANDGDGTALVQGAVLARVAAQLPTETATVWVEDDRLRVTAGRSRFKLHLMPREDFPSLDDVDTEPALVHGPHLTRLLDAALPAVGRDDARELLQGVHLSTRDGRLAAAATDSYRLHVAWLDDWDGGDLDAIVPADAARAVTKTASDDKVGVAGDGKRVRFDLGRRQVVAQVLEGTYPAWGQLVPPDHDHRVVVSGPDLQRALRRCSAVGEESVNGGVVLRALFTSEGIALRAGDSDGEDQVEADTDGASLTFGLNSKYLSEAVAAVAPDGGDVTLDLRDELKPVVVRADGFDGEHDPVAVLMPIRV